MHGKFSGIVEREKHEYIHMYVGVFVVRELSDQTTEPLSHNFDNLVAKFN